MHWHASRDEIQALFFEAVKGQTEKSRRRGSSFTCARRSEMSRGDDEKRSAKNITVFCDTEYTIYIENQPGSATRWAPARPIN